jgi:hypothetical protein
VRVTNSNFGPIIAFLFYQQANKMLLKQAGRAMKELGHTIGFLDGDTHDRDGVPNTGVKKTLLILMFGNLSRMFAIICLTRPLYCLLRSS